MPVLTIVTVDRSFSVRIYFPLLENVLENLIRLRMVLNEHFPHEITSLCDFAVGNTVIDVGTFATRNQNSGLSHDREML